MGGISDHLSDLTLAGRTWESYPLPLQELLKPDQLVRLF